MKILHLVVRVQLIMMVSHQKHVQPVDPSSQQKVQIIRTIEGKIEARGLLPGQQMVQTLDGKYQIIHSQPNIVQKQQQAQPKQAKPVLKGFKTFIALALARS